MGEEAHVAELGWVYRIFHGAVVFAWKFYKGECPEEYCLGWYLGWIL